MHNEIEDAISKVMETEGWEVNKVNKNDEESLHELISLKNFRTLELIIDRKNERILIKNTVTISNDFGNKILGTKKSELKYEFKIFLMAMDIHMQTYTETKDLDTIDISYCLYFDEFSKNRFYHTMYKIGEIPYLFEIMEKKFIESNQ
jgi:hypothetical protein